MQFVATTGSNHINCVEHAMLMMLNSPITHFYHNHTNDREIDWLIEWLFPGDMKSIEVIQGTPDHWVLEYEVWSQNIHLD